MRNTFIAKSKVTLLFESKVRRHWRSSKQTVKGYMTAMVSLWLCLVC